MESVIVLKYFNRSILENEVSAPVVRLLRLVFIVQTLCFLLLWSPHPGYVVILTLTQLCSPHLLIKQQFGQTLSVWHNSARVFHISLWFFLSVNLAYFSSLTFLRKILLLSSHLMKD